MGATLSFLPGWFRGQPHDEEAPAAVQDDVNAGMEAPTARVAISAGHRAWTAAFEQKNFRAISLLYSPECKICPAGSRTTFGREECVLGWESLLKTGVDRLAFSDTTIESSNADIVAETSSYNMYTVANKAVDNGRHMMIWKKVNTKWYIHIHVFSSNKNRVKAPQDHISQVCLLWEYAYFGRDFDTLSSLYTEDCVLCPPAWPQVNGNLPVERFWARFPSMGVDHVDRVTIDVDAMGPDHIAAEIRYTMYDARNGVVDMGKCLSIFKKSSDGRWLLHTEVFNSDASLPNVSTDKAVEADAMKVGITEP